MAPRPWFTGCAVLLAAGLVAGCSPDAEESADYTHPLPEGAAICGRPDFDEMFPYSLRSERLPVLVHYYKPQERDTAAQVLAFVEEGWDYHVDTLGMRPPLTDAGECGPDEDFDVFVWKGHRSCLVDVLGEEPATAWDDRRGFMIVDPWGPYGGAELEETVVHEMAHASQAADDWWETPILFEMSAVFTDQVFADRYIKTYLDDFQLHPDWALDYYDDYETWYMYGASLYLIYLRDRFFAGDPGFVADLWLDSRGPPGAEADQKLNEPDFVDALDAMLAGTSSYLETVPEFARWRWYTGDHIDDNHFKHFKAGLENLAAARLKLAVQQPAVASTITVEDDAPMLLGSSYLELTGSEAVTLSLDAPADPARRFVVQAVPGLAAGSDGELLDLEAGPQLLEFAADGKRTVIVTVLPTGSYDPDLRDDTRYPFSLILGAP